MNISDIRTLDIFEVPPKSMAEDWACELQGSLGFHMGLCVAPVFINGYITDWTTSESISKGPALDRLLDSSELIMARYRAQTQVFYIWRLKNLPEVPALKIYELHSAGGKRPYGYKQDVDTALWWLARHYLHKQLPIVQERGINCISWAAWLIKEYGKSMKPARDLQLVPDNQYAMERTIEKSPKLEFVGILNG